MKKRLLFACAMLLSVASGFAQSVNDYVYTAVGKYKITAEKTTGIVNADFTGWEVVTAEETAPTVADQFNFTAAGMSATVNKPTEGIKYTLSGIDGASNYIVAVTIAQPEPAITMHRSIQPWLCDHIKGDNDVNCLKILGVNMDDEKDSVEYAKPTEILPGEAKNYYFAITPSEAPRNYFIMLKGWAADLFISDIKVFEANQVGDERTVVALLDHAKQLNNLCDWANDAKFQAQEGANDVIDALVENIALAEETIANADAEVEDIEAAVEGLKESIADFEAKLDDFLASSALDKIPFEAPKKVQKENTIGVWEGRGGGGGRIHANQGEHYDVGHYAGNTTWGYGNGMIGLTARIELEPGDYIFSMQTRAMMRLKSTSSCWDVNNAVKSVKGLFYVRPWTDGDDAEFSNQNYEAEQNLALTYKELDMSCTDFEMNTLTFHITEETKGWYEFGIKTYAQEFAKDEKNGGTLEVGDARLFAKTTNKYSKKQLIYWEDVCEQTKTGRDNLTKAAESLANAETPWGKPVLKEVMDEIEPLIAGYEAWSQDDIIATMNPTYNKGTGLEVIDEENTTETDTVYVRGMASEVYRLATKIIIAANNKFAAKNDTLASLNKAIVAAQNAKAFRIYDYATEKAALEALIAEAQNLEAALRADEYSVENAAKIVEMNAALQEAINEMKGSIAPDAITVLADIDFDAYTIAAGGEPEVEDGTVDDLSTGNHPVTLRGTVGAMQISSFSYIDSNNSYNIGIESNGEVLLDGILRVGNGEGTVVIEVPEDNYGTDVVRVSMDWWFGNLSGKSAGFYLKDANDENIGGLYCNRYNGTKDYDATEIFPDGVIGRGSSTQSNAVICEDGNLTHLEYVLDYGNKAAYCVSTLPTKEITTSMVAFSGEPLAKFLLKSNYNNNDRRCWFDNLKIERIKADPNTVGIVNVNAPSAKAGKIYTISGVEVQKAVKGIYIINGKKVVIK